MNVVHIHIYNMGHWAMSSSLRTTAATSTTTLICSKSKASNAHRSINNQSKFLAVVMSTHCRINKPLVSLIGGYRFSSHLPLFGGTTTISQPGFINPVLTLGLFSLNFGANDVETRTHRSSSSNTSMPPTDHGRIMTTFCALSFLYSSNAL